MAVEQEQPLGLLGGLEHEERGTGNRHRATRPQLRVRGLAGEVFRLRQRPLLGAIALQVECVVDAVKCAELDHVHDAAEAVEAGQPVVIQADGVDEAQGTGVAHDRHVAAELPRPAAEVGP